MKPPHMARWAGLALLLVLLLIVANAVFRPVPRQTVRLPDGREMTLLKVSCGTQHRYTHGPPLAKVVAPLLKSRWEHRVGLQTFSWTSATPAMMFWVQWRDPRATNQAPSTAAVCDDQGNESEPVWFSLCPALLSGDRLVGWAFANYPRCARTVGLKIYNFDPRAGAVAEFRTRHPAPHASPVWTYPPPPITQRTGELSCTLLSLMAGKPARPARGLPAEHHANWNTALFQVTEGGVPSPAWRVAGIQAEEATGNICDTKTTAVSLLGDYQLVEFDGALWRGEWRWKFNVELSRVANFAADELCSIPRLPVPTALRSAVRTNLELRVQGLELVSLQLERPLDNPPAIGQFNRNAVVSLETAPAAAETRVTLVRATDDRGRMVLQNPGYSSSNTVHVFDLNLAAGVTNLDLTFAIHHSRFLEFVAKPTCRTNPPATGRP